MAPSEKSSTGQVEDKNACNEAVLTGVVALASLCSTCVEAFSLIHPAHKWEKEEQRLLTRLGLQQARLLVWGSVVGITSPPRSVTDRAVPKHPSSAYPDLTEPTFFNARDPRLDEPAIRTAIESALSAIIDRANHATREEMMAKYGLRPPKRFTPTFEPALDTNRLEAFRERHELLREVAESYAHINAGARRGASLVHTSWVVADVTRFAAYVAMTQAKVDALIALLAVKEPVDRAVRMDIRAFGWHVVMPERTRLAADSAKLRMLKDICAVDYPEYDGAVEQALANIQRENREFSAPPPAVVGKRPVSASPAPATGLGHLHPPQSRGDNHSSDRKSARPGLLSIFRSFGKHSSPIVQPTGVPQRSKSDAGAVISHAAAVDDDAPTLTAVRSKSVGAWIEPEWEEHEHKNAAVAKKRMPVVEIDPHSHPSASEETAHKLQDIRLADDAARLTKGPSSSIQPQQAKNARSMGTTAIPEIVRHDQYRGIARTATRDLHQADY